MKNITKKKIVLVTLGFLLGFSMLIFTNYQENQKADNQPNLKTPNSSTEIFFDDFESGLSKWQSITGLWHLTDTGSAWPDPCHSPTHAMWFGDESTGTFNTGLWEYGELVSIPFSLLDADMATLEFYHWREGEGDIFDVSYVYISIDGFNWDLLYQSSSAYIAPWEQVSLDISGYVGNPSVQLKFFFDTLDELYNDYRGWLVDDIQILAYDLSHDLSVSLDVPSLPSIGINYVINATVTNNGIYDETNVNLFLYLDDVIVNSITISSLPVGASETISYMWIPPDYGIYTFTAYAPPLPDEEYIEDNFVTEIIYIIEPSLKIGFINTHEERAMPDLKMFYENLDYYVDEIYSPITDSLLSNYRFIFVCESWTGTGWNPGEITAVENWMQYGGVLVGLGDEHLADFEQLAATHGITFLGYAEGISGSTSVINSSHPLMTGVTSLYIPSVLNALDVTNPASSIFWDSTGVGVYGAAVHVGLGRFCVIAADFWFNIYDDDNEILFENILSLYYEPPTLTITLPNSYSSWETGTTQSITWTSTGTISDVKIELYKGGVFEMEIIASTTNDGTYNWDIPTDLEDGSDYQIKISDVANPATDDFSDNFETLTSIIDSLTVTKPDSTSTWETGTTQSITWTSTGTISDVKIELYKGGVFEMEIIASTTNDGTYNWAIPTDLEDGSDYQIKISDVSNPATYDESSNFAITRFEIPGYNLYIVIVIMCVVSVILLKKRFKLIK